MALVELEYEERADGLLYPVLDMGEDFFARTAVFEQADRWAREIVLKERIYT